MKLAPIYESVQKTLRIPFVNLIFRSLANYPEYLCSAWWDIEPILHLQTFEQAADELRRQALLSSWSEKKIETDYIEDLEKLRAFNDSIHYVLPKLLLIATALSEKGFGESQTNDDLSSLPKIESGVDSQSTKVVMLDPSSAEGEVMKVFKSVKNTHHHPLVSSYYRALGNWPDFLSTVWEQVKPTVYSTEYKLQKMHLIDESLHLVRQLPNLHLSSIDLTPGHKREIGLLLNAFRYEFIPEMMIDVGIIKSLLDGKESARTSNLSMGRNAEWDH
jgi:hypothetical protein